MSLVINIAEDFTDAPGTRLKADGEFSGEEFREIFLIPLMENNTSATIVLDGLYGSPTSFFDEAFGGLSRIYGSEKVLSLLKFVCIEDPLLIREIKKYIRGGVKK